MYKREKFQRKSITLTQLHVDRTRHVRCETTLPNAKREQNTKVVVTIMMDFHVFEEDKTLKGGDERDVGYIIF